MTKRKKMSLLTCLSPRTPSGSAAAAGDMARRGPLPEVGGMYGFPSMVLAALRLGLASALPAPAIGWQHGPLAPGRARRPPPPAAWPAPGGPALSHLRVGARSVYRGRSAGRAQRRGPGGLAGAGRRRVLPLRARGAPAPGWRVRGSFGAREAPRPYRCAQGIREKCPPPPPPWPVALGQGAEVGVLLAVPSHKATVAIRAACRRRFPSGPRAQNLGWEWGKRAAPAPLFGLTAA